jgi:hypothetical protein
MVTEWGFKTVKTIFYQCVFYMKKTENKSKCFSGADDALACVSRLAVVV